MHSRSRWCVCASISQVDFNEHKGIAEISPDLKSKRSTVRHRLVKTLSLIFDGLPKDTCIGVDQLYDCWCTRKILPIHIPNLCHQSSSTVIGSSMNVSRKIRGVSEVDTEFHLSYTKLTLPLLHQPYKFSEPCPWREAKRHLRALQLDRAGDPQNRPFDSPRKRSRSSCILIISATGRSAATPIDIDSTLSGKILVFYAVVQTIFV